MAIRGTDRWENLGAVTIGHDGAVDYGRPGVRFGAYNVPAAAAWVLEPVGREPSVRAEFEMRDGTPVCLSVTIRATPHGRPVTTTDLATLPGLDRKGVDAFLNLATRIFDDEEWREGRNLERVDAIFHPARSDVSFALKSKPDDQLQRVADIYRENIDSNPTEAVEVILGLSRRTADRRIRLARDRGFLPETTRGKKKA